jgi:hypothetical protein
MLPTRGTPDVENPQGIGYRGGRHGPRFVA